MVIEVAIVAAIAAGASWAYLHFSGKAFDRKYGRVPVPEGESTEPAARVR